MVLMTANSCYQLQDAVRNVMYTTARSLELRQHAHCMWTRFVLSHSNCLYACCYAAIGCPNYRNPVRSWLQAVNYSSLIVHCNDSDTTWSVTCRDGRWESSTAANSCGALPGSVDRGNIGFQLLTRTADISRNFAQF